MTNAATSDPRADAVWAYYAGRRDADRGVFRDTAAYSEAERKSYRDGVRDVRGEDSANADTDWD